MSSEPGRLLRALAALLVRGEAAPFVRGDLDEALRRDVERGVSLRRARARYLRNILASAWNLAQAPPSAWLARRRASRSARDAVADWPSRTMGMVSWVDVTLGVRMLFKQRVVTVVAVLTLALGIPVGMFPTHLADVIEAPLPVPEGDRILTIRRVSNTGATGATGFEDLIYWRDRLTTFETLAATTMGQTFNMIQSDGGSGPVDGALVTASTFEVLRVPALMGRGLLPEDERVGAEDVVVIGQDVWESRLGSDPDILGRVIRVGGVDRTVVGVMPSSFRFPLGDVLWIPARATIWADLVAGLDQPQDWPPLFIFGRLADGVSEEEAIAEVAALGAPPSAEQGPFGTSRAAVTPFWVALMGDVRGDSEFIMVQLLALLVLVIACANVAMLIFARTVQRSMELAVRTALGASRARIISQLFVEALLLAVLAAGTGLFIGDQIILRIIEGPMRAVGWPPWLDLGVRMGTVMQALALAAVSAVLAGVLPALRATGKSVQPTLQRAAADRSGLRFGGISSALIVGDVTIAVVAACFAIIFAPRDDGFDEGTEGWSDSFLSAELTVPSAEGVRSSGPVAVARVAATQEELLRRLRAEPAVRGVAVASALPGMDHDGVYVEVDSARSLAAAVTVEPGFFETIGHPVLSGRDFDQTDLVEGNAVIVNTDFVQKVLGGRNPVGRQLRTLTGRDRTPGPWLEIVGVVGRLGTMNSYSDEQTFEAFYRPASTGQINPAWLAIEIDGDPDAFTPRLRQLAIEVDPSAVIDQPVPLSQVESFAEFGRRMMVLGGTLLVVILVGLAASGTYALMSFTVTQRTREIGIRTALGAQRVGIVLAIGRRALAQLAVGGVLGMVVGLVLLQEVLPTGVAYVLALVLGAGLMIVIGLLACTGPTLKALRITPTEALKAEG